jgi:hypothetical protein
LEFLAPSSARGPITPRYVKQGPEGFRPAAGGNFLSLLLVLEQAERSWYKWLCRRSQRTHLTWERFADLLRDFPLQKPRITVPIWGA